MREIEFRGIDEYGNFVFGGFAKNAMTTYGWLAEFAIISNGCYAIDVEPETIGQFTGLKDRNGVDIYEGDIVTWGDVEGYEEMSGTRYAVVDMSKPENGLTFSSFKPFKQEFEIGNFAYARSTEKCMTVIGNIHQHPELLEEK